MVNPPKYRISEIDPNLRFRSSLIFNQLAIFMHTSANLNRFVETAIACPSIAGARDVDWVNGEDWEVNVIFQANTELEEEG